MKQSIYDSLSQDIIASAESLSVMMQKEQSVYIISDYLHPPVADDTMITESDRLKIVNWCYVLVDGCEFNRETVAMAMEMVDRFLSRSGDIAYRALRDRNQFQLIAMAALYIAIKTNEAVAVGSDFFAAMSRGLYSAEDIEAMELAILQGLSWRICAPTSVQMVHQILSLVNPHVALQESVWGFILDEVRFQTEHALRDYYFATQRPSTLAVAAIFNSIDQISQRDRQAILRALLLVMNQEYDSPRTLLYARSKLQCLIEDDDASGEDTIVSDEPSREVEACFLSRGFGECDFKASTGSTKASPRSMTCCCSRRETVLCENCDRR